MPEEETEPARTAGEIGSADAAPAAAVVLNSSSSSDEAKDEDPAPIAGAAPTKEPDPAQADADPEGGPEARPGPTAEPASLDPESATPQVTADRAPDSHPEAEAEPEPEAEPEAEPEPEAAPEPEAEAEAEAEAETAATPTDHATANATVPPTADRSDPPGAADVEDTAPPGDPERVLATHPWRLDPTTLREVISDPEQLRSLRHRLTRKLDTAMDNRSRARLLSLRAVASRAAGDLDDALADGRLALTYAEATGELRRSALAQARLAHVLRWRGEYNEADRLFAQANSPELPDRLRAALHEHAGRCCVDQGRLIEACLHFERALDLRGTADAELLDRVRVSLDAVADRAAETGFGPYPRSRAELLEPEQPPVPARDGDLWGYADPDGYLVIGAEYAEAQPFREGLAWVRRPDDQRWSLLDRSGSTVLTASWLVVRPFADGLAWVSQGEPGGWRAIDPQGEVVVPPGFADVRPFRHGIAVVRREGWGAVDHAGRLVVPTRYHGFATRLVAGGQVDGFTEDGLAVVDLAGRYGVVDRTGRVVVTPVHAALVVHPVAYLVATAAGRWGGVGSAGRTADRADVSRPGRGARRDRKAAHRCGAAALTGSDSTSDRAGQQGRQATAPRSGQQGRPGQRAEPCPSWATYNRAKVREWNSDTWAVPA